MKRASIDGIRRARWAVSLCFAAAMLLALEALHPGACAWMGLDDQQSFALSALMATVAVFLGSFILTRLIDGRSITA